MVWFDDRLVQYFCCIWSEWPTKLGSWYLAACRSFQTWIWGSWPGHGAEVGKTWCKNDENPQKNWCYWRKCGFLLLGALAALAMVAASQEQRAPPDLEAKKIRQITGGLLGYHDLSRSCAWWITSQKRANVDIHQIGDFLTWLVWNYWY